MSQIAERNSTDTLHDEVARRRTFAIISHPDAGKTTLTEKLLLYSGAVELAGSVRGRKNQRHATSDWMEMEQSRGISITSTSLQFDYQGCRLNLLDTPGHQDFSEDTYRTLMAVDSAIMVLDAAKGIEPQTKKLFDVCRMRNIPILTFINKLDQPGYYPLELLDEIEQVLQIEAAPMNWPIGDGVDFQGVYDLQHQQVLRFSRTEHGSRRAPVEVSSIDDPKLAEVLGEGAAKQLREDVDLLSVAGTTFDHERFLTGKVSPIFFGSALNNFGVETFLQALLDLAPPPGPRGSTSGEVDIDAPFSGFIFKIQANMDPQHRDRIAFLRICSGRFEKDMAVNHQRSGKQLRLTRPVRFFGRERETIEEAFPGDVVGLINPGAFIIGDTISADGPVEFEAIPRFQPEHFASVRNVNVAKYKQFHKALGQLEEEGAIQVLNPFGSHRTDPILAAVGELQFEVVQARMQSEYGVETAIGRLPYTHARWIAGGDDVLSNITWPSNTVLRARDGDDHIVALFSSEWQVQYCIENNPGVEFRTVG
ncbi:MAG: peptide chain release factor 3 [Chloroflexia bacterium]|nr:peptide chain release factor 3 [Chloroflexia bacterium]